MNKEKLIKFEEEIATLFNSGKIKAPVHLYHGNEDQIINVFKKNQRICSKCEEIAAKTAFSRPTAKFPYTR